MPKATYSTTITLPIKMSRVVKLESLGRSKISVKRKPSQTTIIIEAQDIAALKASINSVLRDLTVVENISKRNKN